MQREIDRYDNWRPLGSGGFGAVHRARDRRLGREVSIKVINLPYFAETESERRRRDDHIGSILREPRLAARLQHTNIITVHDFLVEEQQIYIVMEFLPDSLSGHILPERPIPYRRAVEIALQVCRGLSQAHNNGVVHRDIKPPNILLTEDGTVKIADFGLAREVGSSGGVVPTRAIATWEYAPPEQQLSNQPIDHRADIYSLGVTLFEMLTGSLPFRGEYRHVEIEHRESPVPRIPEHLGVPGNVEDIVRRAMEKRPEDRFANADAMATALTNALAASSGRDPQPVRPSSRGTPAAPPPRPVQ